jgi:hypothetical protein
MSTRILSSTASSVRIPWISCRHWAPKPKPSLYTKQINLPSWILPIDGHAFGGPKKLPTQGRINGDSFVGLPERDGPYKASGKIPPSFSFGKTNAVIEKPVEEEIQIPGTYATITPRSTYAAVTPRGEQELPPQFDGILKVKGILLGTIKRTAPIAGGVFSRMALELCCWGKGKGANNIEQLWRLLVANRGPNGTDPPSWYRRTCQNCLVWYDDEPEDTFNTNILKDIPGTPPSQVEFLDRVQQVVWNRNVISIEDTPKPFHGLIGLAPQRSQSTTSPVFSLAVRYRLYFSHNPAGITGS